MTPIAAGLLALLMVATATLSGVFGMAGGMILIGVLLVALPVPAAMVLHAVTQMASNAWRAVLWWRHIAWATTAAYVAGCVVALGLWSIVLWVPDKGVALLVLGLSPFIVRALPDRILPRAMTWRHAAGGGVACMMLTLVTGVTGPLLDQLFLRSGLERRTIVATKASCQVFGHSFKLLYFGGLVADAGRVELWVLALAVAASMLGTTLGKLLLEKLTEAQFRRWAERIIAALGLWYVGHGVALLSGVL